MKESQISSHTLWFNTNSCASFMFGKLISSCKKYFSVLRNWQLNHPIELEMVQRRHRWLHRTISVSADKIDWRILIDTRLSIGDASEGTLGKCNACFSFTRAADVLMKFLNEKRISNPSGNLRQLTIKNNDYFPNALVPISSEKNCSSNVISISSLNTKIH